MKKIPSINHGLSDPAHRLRRSSLMVVNVRCKPALGKTQNQAWFASKAMLFKSSRLESKLRTSKKLVAKYTFLSEFVGSASCIVWMSRVTLQYNHEQQNASKTSTHQKGFFRTLGFTFSHSSGMICVLWGTCSTRLHGKPSWVPSHLDSAGKLAPWCRLEPKWQQLTQCGGHW